MTINSTTRKAGPFIGNGGTTVFPFAFKVFTASDLLVVKLTVSTGSESTLVLNSDYTVTLNLDQDSNPGGSITLLAGALATGYNLILTSDIADLQPTDLTNQGGFYPDVINDALDRATIQIQQLQEETDRSLKYPISDAALGTTLPSAAQRAGVVLAFDENAEPVAGPTVAAVGTVLSNIANINTVATNIVDVNTVADNVADVNTVASNIADVNTVADNIADVGTVATNIADVIIAADNVADINNFADVYQGAKASDPTLRNNGSPLQPGDMYFNTSVNELRLYSGTVWVAGTAGTMAVQRFSGTGSQTAFTLTTAPSGENNTQVYINGVYQQKDTYSVTGTTLTFSAAPPSGTDNIEVVTISTLALGQTTASLVSITDSGNYYSSGTVEGALQEAAQFTQDGASATLRTKNSKLKEWVSPADFGAAGNAASDGSSGTNDSAAFALLEASHTGKIVNLNKKIYLVDSPVPHANMYINGRFVLSPSVTDDQPANFAIGEGAFLSNTFIPRQHPSSTLTFASGNFNTAIGANTMYSNTTGRRNTAVGSQAMYSNTSGYYNTAVGAYAQFNMTLGNYNVAIGNQCQQYLTTGSSNVAVGNGTMVQMANGVDNTAVGDIAMTAVTNRSVAIGKQAAAAHTGNDSIAIGYQALSAPTSSGAYNVVIGNASGGSLTTGNSNTALGRRALSANSTGSSNTAIGNDAMVSATGGSSNTAVGSTALPNNTTGYQNVAVGVNALTVNTTGFNNVAVGRYAAQANTDGAGNVSIGEQSLASNTTGNYNTAIGTGANSGGTANTNTTALGYQATVTGSNQVQLGNSTTTTYAYGAVQNRSDARDKTDVQKTALGLDFINSLRPVDFKWDYREDYFKEELVDVERVEHEESIVGTGILDENGVEFTRTIVNSVVRVEQILQRIPIEKDGSKKRNRYHHGLIAQEVKAACDAAGIDFGGFQDHSIKGGKDVMSLGYEEFISPLIKAVQELTIEIETLKAKVA